MQDLQEMVCFYHFSFFVKNIFTLLALHQRSNTYNIFIFSAFNNLHFKT